MFDKGIKLPPDSQSTGEMIESFLVTSLVGHRAYSNEGKTLKL